VLTPYPFITLLTLATRSFILISFVSFFSFFPLRSCVMMRAFLTFGISLLGLASVLRVHGKSYCTTHRAC